MGTHPAPFSAAAHGILNDGVCGHGPVDASDQKRATPSFDGLLIEPAKHGGFLVKELSPRHIVPKVLAAFSTASEATDWVGEVLERHETGQEAIP